MGRRVLRRHIWSYAVCLCPIKGTPGLNELKETVIFPKMSEYTTQNLISINVLFSIQHSVKLSVLDPNLMTTPEEQEWQSHLLYV